MERRMQNLIMIIMSIHTIRDYLLFMFFSFMIDYIKFRLALAISFNGNFHMMRREETFI